MESLGVPAAIEQSLVLALGAFGVAAAWLASIAALDRPQERARAAVLQAMTRGGNAPEETEHGHAPPTNDGELAGESTPQTATSSAPSTAFSPSHIPLPAVTMPTAGQRPVHRGWARGRSFTRAKRTSRPMQVRRG